ncbi:DUF4124 domain-containing protein [Duganella radicis]|nr:DUF4124 domain-containing protein [Duganella radicis]
MKLILCAALAATCGTAGAAVNKCVDPEGHVLYTDVDCPQGATMQAQEDERPDVQAAPPVLPPVTTPAPRSRWADLPRPLVRKASIDMTTLKAAHENMQLEEALHKSRRLLTSR